MFEKEEIEHGSYLRPMGIKKDIYKKKIEKEKVIRYNSSTKPLLKK